MDMCTYSLQFDQHKLLHWDKALTSIHPNQFGNDLQWIHPHSNNDSPEFWK